MTGNNVPVDILTPVKSIKCQFHVLAVVAAGVAVHRMYCVPMCFVQALYPALSPFQTEYRIISSPAWGAAHSWAFTVRSGLPSLISEASKHSCLACLRITMHLIDV